MQNGYFRLESRSGRYGVALLQPQGGGEKVRIEEVTEYLDDLKIGYVRQHIETVIQGEENGFCVLGQGACPAVAETYRLKISGDGMSAVVRFFSPSETGGRICYDDFLRDLRFRKISCGIRTDVLQSHFQMEGVYCTDLIAASGKEPVQGIDARIEYCFNTTPNRAPRQKEDGGVDFFHIDTINYCKKGQELAKIIPEKAGENGFDIFGNAVKAREVKGKTLKFGRNIELSEDRLSIRSTVDGHVTLTGDKVFVSEVFEVRDVDVSTGNLDFGGSIQISGDVKENFEVKAGGNVIIDGMAEGAKITAGGNIIIARGMNGMGKGTLRAGGNITVKYMENVTAVAGGCIDTEAILHSRVAVGGEVRVNGRRGMIAGGCVQAGAGITAKFIGARLGTATIVEVGVNPLLKAQAAGLQKKIEESEKAIKDAEVILDSFKEKLRKGVKQSEKQINYVMSIAKQTGERKSELAQMQEKLEAMQGRMKSQKTAEIVVNEEVFPGTTLIVGEAVRTVQTSYHYCRFVKEEGEVRMAPL